MGGGRSVHPDSPDRGCGNLQPTTNATASARQRARPPALGGSQNRVDLATDSWLFDAAWDVSEGGHAERGLDWVSARGHYDPAGLYNGYALATGIDGTHQHR